MLFIAKICTKHYIRQEKPQISSLFLEECYSISSYSEKDKFLMINLPNTLRFFLFL